MGAQVAGTAGRCFGTAGAFLPRMFISSTEIPSDRGTFAGTCQNAARVSAVRQSLDHCEVCAAPVDLTKTVIMKANRVLGCPGCEWGALATARAVDVD